MGGQLPFSLLKPGVGYTFLLVCAQGRVGMGREVFCCLVILSHPLALLGALLSVLLAGVTGNSLQRSSPNPTELRQPPASLQLPESSFVSFE